MMDPISSTPIVLSPLRVILIVVLPELLFVTEWSLLETLLQLLLVLVTLLIARVLLSRSRDEQRLRFVNIIGNGLVVKL